MTFFHTNPSIIFLFLISLILSSHLYNVSADDSEVEDESPFAYLEDTGKGPTKWGNIDPLWKACGNGKLQSPIDLLNRRVQVFPSLGKLKGDYKPAQAVVKNRGHDISMAWKGDAGHININGTDYNLQQCHWHSPSEHTFNGSRFDLELHVVHQNPSTNKIAAIGVVYKYGRPDPLLTNLFHHIKSVGKEEIDLGMMNPRAINFESKEYYRYIGSLTVPPCTEGVTWTIVKKVMTVSREQVAALRGAVHDGFESNSRPTQELGEREVRFYTEKKNVGSN
ncbi:alpha carbonic anhydrase 4-like [Quercus robur]|uniref:alpha carbonic anhydrase 4-like n=1 Tax=Quercus robur TaxID=38942 RepID=UPI002163261D|nr:alpha carbonic anhydrase 4-like [Quercus robur]